MNPPRNSLHPVIRFGSAILVVVAAAIVASTLQPHFHDSTIAMIYVLAVAAVALFLGLWPALAACVLSIGLFDYYNLPPYRSFSATRADYVLTFAAMMVTATTISTMADRLRRQAEEAAAREARTAALLALSRDLATLAMPDEILAATLRHVSRAFDAEAAATSDAAAAPLFDHGRETIRRDERSGLLFICMPVIAGSRPYTHVMMTGLPSRLGTGPQLDHLRAMLAYAGQAIERSQLKAELADRKLVAEREALRTSILGTLSHDLRTPLAAIIGASSTLLQEGDSFTADARTRLRQVIYEEAVQMHAMIENFLDMARFRSGDVVLNNEWQAVEEIVGSALRTVGRRQPGREFMADVPVSLPLLRFDGALVSRVLVNLLENAVRHTPAGTPVTVRAQLAGSRLVLEVCDRGPGIPAADRERVFEPFSRLDDRTPGTGLGLAICHAIIRAHHGDIRVDDNPGGGTCIRMEIPAPVQLAATAGEAGA